MNEFDLIKTYFAPLAKDFPGSLNLTDDAALIDVPDGQQLVVTKDAITQGVHFVGDENPAQIARKLLRVNLSDLATMGATPLCYFLAVMLPTSTDETWIKAFAHGLAADQKEFAIHLAGGDTTATLGTLSLSITALGLTPKGTSLKRSGAKPGDIVYVSGTLGDAALGLYSDDPFLKQRYLLPQPRITLGQKLRTIASAAIDISDGLLQDLSHICNASHASATIHRAQLPLSDAGAKAVAENSDKWEKIIAGGDDYELLFCAAPDKANAIETIARELDSPLTAIGKIIEGEGVALLDEHGKQIPVTRTGFQHF